jgi:hypothetical protein
MAKPNPLAQGLNQISARTAAPVSVASAAAQPSGLRTLQGAAFARGEGAGGRILHPGSANRLEGHCRRRTHHSSGTLDRGHQHRFCQTRPTGNCRPASQSIGQAIGKGGRAPQEGLGFSSSYNCSSSTMRAFRCLPVWSSLPPARRSGAGGIRATLARTEPRALLNWVQGYVCLQVPLLPPPRGSQSIPKPPITREKILRIPHPHTHTYT